MLRPYQAKCVDAIYSYLRENDGNPCAVIPTGGGKTHVMQQICSDTVHRWRGRALILAHVKELLEQAAEKLTSAMPGTPIGIYSAGLGTRDVSAVTIAGIQSVYQRAHVLGAFDLIIVDEAHMIPFEGDGMYRQYLRDALVINPDARVIGLTATPFRMKGGMICGPDNILTEICYEAHVRELMVQGYLCPLKTRSGNDSPDFDDIEVRGGEFVAGQAERAMDSDRLVENACAEIVRLTADRKSVLIFASGVRHGEHVTRILTDYHGADCEFVHAETLNREVSLRKFRERKLKYLANVNVLTTGFDAQCTDCIVLLRPTMSPGLFCQMVGRGFRMYDGKTDCLILDYGGNVLRHGPVDQIRIETPRKNAARTGEAAAKECSECKALVATGYATCPECGHPFPGRQRTKHSDTADDASILSFEVLTTEFQVLETFACVHEKKGAEPDAPKTMRVDYRISFQDFISEWICFEHSGYAREKAEAWWAARSDAPCPATAAEGVAAFEAGFVAPCTGITTQRKSNDKFPRITAHVLGAKPTVASDEAATCMDAEAVSDEDVEIPDQPAAIPSAEGRKCPKCNRGERTYRRPADEWLAFCSWCGSLVGWVSENAVEDQYAERIPF